MIYIYIFLVLKFRWLIIDYVKIMGPNILAANDEL